MTRSKKKRSQSPGNKKASLSYQQKQQRISQAKTKSHGKGKKPGSKFNIESEVNEKETLAYEEKDSRIGSKKPIVL